MKQKIQDGANEFKAGSLGDVYADTFGRFKFREHDKNGLIVPNQYLDGIEMPGEQTQYFTGQFSDFYEEKVPAHVIQANKDNSIMPPGQKFAQGLIEKYMQTAPIDFQVHRPPKMMDLTQSLGDGVHHFENDKVSRRRIQMLNLQN